MSARSASLVLAMVTVLTPIGLRAQRGQGGVGGAGFHSGAYPYSVPAARPAIPNLGGRPYPIRTDIPTPIGLNPPAASYTGILPGAYKPQFNGGGRYNRGGGTLIAAPLYYPYLGYGPSLNTFPSYNETIDPNAQAFAAMQDALGEQIRQLTVELDSVKRQVNVPLPPSPGATPSAPAAGATTLGESDAASQRSVVVVLKNGQQLSVQSYAVMNGFLWDFSKQPVRKIAITSVDVPASVKATEENGTEFPDLSSGAQTTVSH